MKFFETPARFVASLKKLMDKEYDNVMLFTGHEGAGKSYLMLKYGKALDPSFNVNRVWFEWEDFKRCAKDLPPGSVVVWDEVKASKFRQGSRTSEEFRNHLQETRGLFLHQIFVLPHWEILDPSLIPLRVRYNLHVTKRGVYKVRRPLRRMDANGDQSMDWNWRTLKHWVFDEPKGPLVQRYRHKKRLHMAGKGVHYDNGEPVETVVDGFDATGADQILLPWLKAE